MTTDPRVWPHSRDPIAIYRGQRDWHMMKARENRDYWYRKTVDPDIIAKADEITRYHVHNARRCNWTALNYERKINGRH